MKALALVWLPSFLFAQSLKFEKTIPLPGVEGRIDHFAVDVAGKRLFMAALGNNTVEVIDPFAGKVLHTIAGLHEPQGLYYWPEGNRLYVANATNGHVQAFDGSSYQQIRDYDFNSDADNIRFDPLEKEVFIGYGDGALGVINATHQERTGETILDGHPESFQLEAAGPRIFVNVPNGAKRPGHVTVIDRRTRSIVVKWPIDGAAQNYPMALDASHQLLFIGCRRPARMVVLDTVSGKQVASVEIVGDTDDLFFDSTSAAIYVSGGAGSITVIKQIDGDHYSALGNVPTARGARTSLFVPEFKRLYVAVPRRGLQSAALMVFATGE